MNISDGIEIDKSRINETVRENMRIDIFKYKRRLSLFLIFIPISFIYFLFSAILSYILFKELFPEAWLYFSLIIFLTISRIEAQIISHFRFYPLGEIIVKDNMILVNSKEGNEEYLLNEIKNMKIYYAGDRYWQPLIKIFRKSKGRSRYVSVHWTKREDEIMSIDKIFIEGKEFQIKIRNQEEKNNLFNMISYLKRKKINVDLEGEIS